MCLCFSAVEKRKQAVHQRLMALTVTDLRDSRYILSSLAGTYYRLRATVCADQIQKHGNTTVSSSGPWKMYHPTYQKTTKLRSEFKHFLPSEFLLVEEIPQTPPSISNMDVFICGLSALQNAVQLSVTGRPPSHVCVKNSLETGEEEKFS